MYMYVLQHVCIHTIWPHRRSNLLTLPASFSLKDWNLTEPPRRLSPNGLTTQSDVEDSLMYHRKESILEAKIELGYSSSIGWLGMNVFELCVRLKIPTQTQDAGHAEHESGSWNSGRRTQHTCKSHMQQVDNCTHTHTTIPAFCDCIWVARGMRLNRSD